MDDEGPSGLDETNPYAPPKAPIDGPPRERVRGLPEGVFPFGLLAIVLLTFVVPGGFVLTVPLIVAMVVANARLKRPRIEGVPVSRRWAVALIVFYAFLGLLVEVALAVLAIMACSWTVGPR